MSDELADRVADLLASVQEELHSDAVPDDAESIEDVGEDAALPDHAATAREIIETNGPKAVLETVGIAADGDGLSSIPAAIASSSETDVRELRALIQLARLDAEGDENDDQSGAALRALRETLEPDADEESSVQDDHDRGAQDESDAQAESDGEDDRETQSGSKSDRDGVDLGEVLQTATGTTLEEFGADLESLRGRLESALGDDTDSESSTSDADTAEADAGSTGDEATEEPSSDEATEELSSDEAAEESDDGRFDIGGESDDGGRSSMHSTMPSSDRADMRAVRRHSTMPDRH